MVPGRVSVAAVCPASTFETAVGADAVASAAALVMTSVAGDVTDDGLDVAPSVATVQYQSVVPEAGDAV